MWQYGNYYNVWADRLIIKLIHRSRALTKLFSIIILWNKNKLFSNTNSISFLFIHFTKLISKHMIRYCFDKYATFQQTLVALFFIDLYPSKSNNQTIEKVWNDSKLTTDSEQQSLKQVNKILPSILLLSWVLLPKLYLIK